MWFAVVSNSLWITLRLSCILIYLQWIYFFGLDSLWFLLSYGDVFLVKIPVFFCSFICSICRIIFVVDPQDFYKWGKFYIRCILVYYCILIFHHFWSISSRVPYIIHQTMIIQIYLILYVQQCWNLKWKLVILLCCSILELQKLI